jgi:cadmium resistance protein CadD (predicted permease)
VHSIIGALAVAVIAFVATAVDGLFSFAGQLALTNTSRIRRVCVAHAAAMVVLLGISAGIAASLSPVPVRWVGVVALALVGLAIHAIQQRRVLREQFARGVFTTFTMTLVYGAAVLVTWVALLRANGVAHGAIMAGAFCVVEVAFINIAKALRGRTRLIAWGRAHTQVLVPIADLVLGVLIVWECHTF